MANAMANAMATVMANAGDAQKSRLFNRTYACPISGAAHSCN